MEVGCKQTYILALLILDLKEDDPPIYKEPGQERYEKRDGLLTLHTEDSSKKDVKRGIGFRD